MKIQDILIWLGIGVGGGTAATVVYHDYQDTENYTIELGDQTKWTWNPMWKWNTIWVHHIAGTSTPEAVDALHAEKFSSSGGIGYSWWGEKDGRLLHTSTPDIRKAHTRNQNSSGRAYVFNGNFEVEYPSDAALDKFEVWLFSALVQNPQITRVDYHGNNPHSNTACPGKNLTTALKARGLFFNSREEMQPWLAKMENRILNTCLDGEAPGFIDGEPC